MRIAIVGAGPTGFFLAAALSKAGPDHLTVDMFEKTPFPFGLVRFGVAPDHGKIKSVTKGFQATLDEDRFSFFGNLTLAEQERGGSLTMEELIRHYDRIVLTVGCQDDQKLGIPNEDAENSFSATRFVGWYNGHPEDRKLNPNLEITRAAVVGAGNVAIDVFRFLASSHERMAATDASDHSLDALKNSTLRELDVLIRRGAWDVAFTNPEVRELLDFEDVQFTFSPELPPLEQPPAYADRRSVRNLEVFHELAGRKVDNPRLVVNFHFQVSPCRLGVAQDGQVCEVELVHNDLVYGESRSSITATERRTTLPCQLFIRSVGYRGRPLARVPFDTKTGLIPCDTAGRVLDLDGKVVPGLYVSGWMRRGPSGVIGTNKKDAQEVATALLADSLPGPSAGPQEYQAFRQDLIGRGAVSKEDWNLLDQWELRSGESSGKPRRKLVTLDQVMEALQSAKSATAAG